MARGPRNGRPPAGRPGACNRLKGRFPAALPVPGAISTVTANGGILMVGDFLRNAGRMGAGKRWGWAMTTQIKTGHRTTGQTRGAGIARRWRLALAVLVPVLAVAACGPSDQAEDKTAPPAPVTSSAPDLTGVPLISRDVFFGNPERISGRISPDGTRMSFIAPLEGVLNVWTGPVGDFDAAAPVTADTGRGIMNHGWAANGSHLIYVQDKGGDENFRAYAVDLANGQAQDLTPFDGVRAQIIKASYDHPDEMLFGLNNRDPRWHDVWRINVVTGERALVEQNDGFGGYVADNDLMLRLAFRPLQDGSQLVLKKDAEGAWADFFTISKDDSLTVAVDQFNKDGTGFYMIDSTGRDTAALVLVDFETGERALLAEDARADVADVLYHPTEDYPLAYAVDYTRKEWTVLEDSVAPDFALLNERLTGDYTILDTTEDNRRWIVGEDQAAAPYTYYLLDRDDQSLTRMFTTRPQLEGQLLNQTYAEVITARDGLKLVSYLTLPQGTDVDGDGRPSAPVPLVLDVHGGPWARTSYGYNSWSQWLSNRGYAVLNVNFRGSTGFGKDFINKGDREWGRAMHDDLLDAVAWAVDEGITTADQVAIAGGSYGGYAVLAGLTMTPQTFACGVDIVGPSNLTTLLESIPPYWTAFFETLAQRVGDPRTEEGRALLKERSPVFLADRIERPLLIGQGANDPRVKQAESDQIVTAMTENGLPVTYVLFPDEGHGFARPENRLAFYAVMDAFLADCLGGRFEPIGDDFAGSSTGVPVGAEHVEGLDAALADFEPVVVQ